MNKTKKMIKYSLKSHRSSAQLTNHHPTHPQNPYTTQNLKSKKNLHLKSFIYSRDLNRNKNVAITIFKNKTNSRDLDLSKLNKEI